MSIIWDDAKFGTGVPEIDAQHMEWLRRVNLFDDSVMNGRERELIYNTLAFLVEYSIQHFTLEESIMAKSHCPALKANIAAHAKFRLRLDEILRQIELSGPSAFNAIAIKIELEQWLVNHICTIDIGLRGCR
jgi:hemerythrin